MLRTILITVLSILSVNAAASALTGTKVATNTKTAANSIIEVGEGLTLAQINEDGLLHTLAVIEDNDRIIQAINLSKLTGMTGGIVEVYQTLGYNQIERIIEDNQNTASEPYRYEQLMSPAGSGLHHIALGFNYADHADEIDQEHQPFLFLKTTQPTREQSVETNENTLLDYEVEICARPLQSIEDSSPGTRHEDGLEFGFFLCGDFTDRASLMSHINPDNMRSGQGFSNAKSRKTFFPTGPYMVIPKDTEGFLNQVSFSLYRNGELKQNASTSMMIWSLDAAVNEAFSYHRNQKPTYSSRTNLWLPDHKVTSDMVFLTGTPEGVILQPPSTIFRAMKGIVYLLSGSFLSMDLRDYVVNSFIQVQFDKGTFLQPGERVVMRSSFLGEMSLDIALGLTDHS